jgi:hypothetical protein
MEIVESATNIEICIIKDGHIETMADDQLESIVKEIKSEKEAAEEAKKAKAKKD